MKKLFKLALIVSLVLCVDMATAQTVKFGYINSKELIQMMPELDSAQVKLEAYSKELQEQSEAIMVEYNKKLNDYKAKAETYTPAINEQKRKELSDLETRYQEFAQVAQRDLQEQEGNLMAPIIAKAKEAIRKVAKANGITMVFDYSVGVFDQSAVLYVDEATTVNLLPLVKADLKIVDKKPAAPAAAVQR